MIVEIPPFTTLVWKNPKARDRYSAAIREFEIILHKVELLMIKKGLRRCDVEHILPEIMQEQLVMLYKMGFKFKPLAIVKRYSGFAHKHEYTSDIRQAMIFGVVGLKEEDLELFAKAYYSSDHDTQGMLLGYPKCCRDFFVKVWKEKEYDPIYRVALNTGIKKDGTVVGDPLLNVMLRYIGLRFCLFFPCSFKCPNAHNFAVNVLKLTWKVNKKVVERVLELFNKELIWSQVNGIIEVTVEDTLKIICGGYSDEKQFIRFIPEYNPIEVIKK